MPKKPWENKYWPQAVPPEITGYDLPVFSLLDDAARDYPDKVFTIFNDATRTYAETKDSVDRIANFLTAAGIKKGDRVAIFLPNLPHYPIIYFGILKAGGVCVTCNPLYTAPELNYQLNDAGAKAVFCMDHPQFYETAAKAVEGTDVNTVVICNVKSFLPALKGFIGGLLGKIPKAGKYRPGHLFFDDVVASAPPKTPVVDINPSEDLAVIIYTGGTTGVPKGAALTHSNLVANVFALREWTLIVQEPGGPAEKLKTGGHHCYLGVLPWYHSFGMTVAMLSACHGGQKLVCIPDPRAGNPPFTDVLKAVQKYKPTIVPAVPTIFVAFTNHPDIDKFDLSSIMACASGGAPLPVEAAKQFEAKTGAIIFEGYGLSETSPIAAANPSNLEGREFGTVGYPVSSTDIKILDLETGLEELPEGDDGEIGIHGPQVMQGYWNKPEENKAVFREVDGKRFFLTGDIGHLDEFGRIVITDRKKDLIIVGGFNVYPRDVEEILYKHPKIAMAAVVGLPDAKSGEYVKAYIQMKPGETAATDEVLAFCKENMAGYKRPKAIEVRDSLPTSPIGKVLRRVLREEEMEKAKEKE